VVFGNLNCFSHEQTFDEGLSTKGKMDKKTNGDLQTTTHKTTDRAM
jgi:hypothetical protein